MFTAIKINFIFCFVLILGISNSYAGGPEPLFSLPAGSDEDCFKGIDVLFRSKEAETLTNKLINMVDSFYRNRRYRSDRRYSDTERKEYQETINGLAALGVEVVLPLVKVGQKKYKSYYLPYYLIGARGIGYPTYEKRYAAAVGQIISMIRDPKAIPILKKLVKENTYLKNSSLLALIAMKAEFTGDELWAIVNNRPEYFRDPNILTGIIQMTMKLQNTDEAANILILIERKEVDTKLDELDGENLKLVIQLIEELGKTRSSTARQHLAYLHDTYSGILKTNQKEKESAKFNSFYSDTGRKRILSHIELSEQMLRLLEKNLK